MPDFEPILKSRRYVLGETEEYYGIWDRQEGRGPFERFPLTAEGFDAAERRFHQLSRTSRLKARRVAPVIAAILVVAAIAWVVAGVFLGISAFVSPEAFPTATRVSAFTDSVAYRVAFAALMVLVAFLLVEMLRRQTTESGRAGDIFEGWRSGGRLEQGLLWTAAIGLGLWAALGLVTTMVEPRGFRSLVEGVEPSTVFVAAQVIESLAFRVWVAAAVLLGLGWARGSIRAR